MRSQPSGLQRYLNMALHSPGLVARRALHALPVYLRNAGGRVHAALFGTALSEHAFVRALRRDLRDPAALAAHLGSPREAHFFLGFARRDEFVAAIRAVSPHYERQVVAAANAITDQIFDLLGSGPVSLGPHIDWHCDFKSGHRWDARQYYADVRPAPFPGGYDIKVPWELSRCQHVVWLGQAYWLTGDEHYSATFVAQIESWIAQNPPRLGVNWACTMDVALRAVNWLWGYHFFGSSPALSHDFRRTLIKSLLVHGRHIMANLERYEGRTNNHYLANLVGLVYLGIVLTEFPEASRWCRFALRELERELMRQVYVDGVDFEASVSYHRLALELFLSAMLLAELNGHHFSTQALRRLERMFEFTLAITGPDGTVPLIGDSDDGRAHRLKVWEDGEREWLDHRYLLAIGAVRFGRLDLARAAGDQWEEATWFFGGRVIEQRERAVQAGPLQPGSQSFPTAGIYVLRHADYCMVVDAGSGGQAGQGGHAHNDTLSFVLTAGGHPWIIDPGTYLYTADYQARNLFRSTAYHNLPSLGDTELNPLGASIFALSGAGAARVRHWQSTATYDVLVAECPYRGVAPSPAFLCRQICFVKEGGVWLIRDRIEGSGRYPVTWRFHLADGIRVAMINGGEVILAAQHPSAALMMRFTHPPSAQLELSQGQYWQSPSYGVRRLAERLECQVEAALPLEIAFTMHLHDVSDTLVAQASVLAARLW